MGRGTCQWHVESTRATFVNCSIVPTLNRNYEIWGVAEKFQKTNVRCSTTADPSSDGSPRTVHSCTYLSRTIRDIPCSDLQSREILCYGDMEHVSKENLAPGTYRVYRGYCCVRQPRTSTCYPTCVSWVSRYIKATSLGWKTNFPS